MIISIATITESTTEPEAPAQSMQRKYVDDGNLTNDIDVIYHNMDSLGYHPGYSFSWNIDQRHALDDDYRTWNRGCWSWRVSQIHRYQHLNRTFGLTYNQ
jgi:hypothetical protein